MTPEQKQRIEQRVESAIKDIPQQQERHISFRNDDLIQLLRDLLSLVKSQEAGSDLQSRDDVLKFFGASLKENGDLSIDMKKYHAAHLCQEHSFEPWRRNEIEDKCVMCLARDRENAATSMRSACVEELKGLARERVKQSKPNHRDHEYDQAVAFVLLQAAEKLESLSIEKPKEQG